MHCNFLEFNFLDVSTPQNIQQNAQFELPDIAQYCEIMENNLFVYTPNSSLMIFDVADPQDPHKLLQNYKGDGFFAIHAIDDLLFYTRFSKLFISDVSDPSHPVVLDSLNATRTITHIAKQQNILFVADYDTLQVFDISNIHAPVRLKTLETGRIQDMKILGNRLYCTGHSGFYFFDFSDPQQITRSEIVYNMATNSIAIKDSMVYLMSKVYPYVADYSLKVFNVNSPDNIQLISQLMPGKDFEYGVVDGDYLYVQEVGVGVHVFDIEEAVPNLCGFYPVSIFSSRLAAQNGLLYVPSGWGVDFVANDLLASSGGIFIEQNRRLKMFPNPSGERIYFEPDEIIKYEPLQYTIIQSNGTEVEQGHLLPGQHQLSLEGLSAGIYVLKLEGKSGAYKSGVFIKH